ncbi:ABC transporter permease, partial [Candidatus Gottesmanbacteria bacterium]|nr:ABC transporter permease [Candidatus Gottesmanbacteria bacterium]
MTTLDIAWKHMRRSPYQAMAAILTMFLTLLLVGLFFLTSAASYVILQYFESKPQITVYFQDKTSQEVIQKLQHDLTATGKTTTIMYISKDEALTIYREQNKNDPLLLEMVTADILPASLEVSATDPNYLSDLEVIIKQAEGVEEVVYQRDVVETLISWTNAIRWVGGSLAGLLAIDSILIVMTIIGMKIALKKQEVEVLNLVGASPWYIRAPFVLEGGLYGLFGAGIASLIIGGVTIWLYPLVFAFLGVIPVISGLLGAPTSTPFLISAFGFFGGLALIGFLLGSIGSLVAVGRYL